MYGIELGTSANGEYKLWLVRDGAMVYSSDWCPEVEDCERQVLEFIIATY